MGTRPEGQGPVFVVGAPRSGTTLLRYMLCSHPRLYLPPESNFIPRFFRRRPHRTLSRTEARRILERIATYRPFWRDWDGAPPDPETLLADLDTLTPASLIASLYSLYAHSFGAERWGDKSPIYTDHIDLLAEMFPAARFVHIVRDPRDVTASSLSTYRGPRFFYVDAYYAARRWRDSVRRARASGARLGPERYHELSYEALATDPERELRTLCSFLGETYASEMASPEQEARRHHHSSGIHRRVRAPVTTSSAGRWRRDLSITDQLLVQEVAGDTLGELGYPVVELGSPGILGRLRHAALASKFEMMTAGRGALRAMGLFHPTSLIASVVRRPSGRRLRSA